MNSQYEIRYWWVLLLLGLLPAYSLLRGKVGRLAALTFSSVDIARAAGAQARSSPGRFLFFLRLLTIALVIAALAGWRRDNYHVETETPGIDIMLVLDLSWSMMAIDMGRPEERLTRFACASGVLKDFIAKRPNDRIGLLVFSGVPYLASPLTLNHAWLNESIQHLHIGIINEVGTSIGDAIVVAALRLKDAKSRSRIMIMLTDGDNNMGKIDPLPAAQLAAAEGLKIYTIGIGIEAPCNMPRFDPATGQFMLDQNGNIVPTLLLQPANYSVLGKMADLSGGHFFRATNQRELQNIYDQIDHLEKTEVKQRRFTTYEPLFFWLLLPALGLLALELILAETRFRRIP